MEGKPQVAGAEAVAVISRWVATGGWVVPRGWCEGIQVEKGRKADDRCEGRREVGEEGDGEGTYLYAMQNN